MSTTPTQKLKSATLGEPQSKDEVMGLGEEKEKDVMLFMEFNDGTEKTMFQIYHKSAKISKLIKNIIENLETGDTYGTESNPVKLDNEQITAAALDYTIKYMQKYKGKEEAKAPPKPLTGSISSAMGDEHKEFVCLYNESDSYKEKLKKLEPYINTANYLDMRELLHKFCAVAAAIIRDESNGEKIELAESQEEKKEE